MEISSLRIHMGHCDMLSALLVVMESQRSITLP